MGNEYKCLRADAPSASLERQRQTPVREDTTPGRLPCLV